jgi:protein tyrosine/serine phosphatase
MVVEGRPVDNYGVIWGGRLSQSATPNDEAQWRWLRARGVNTIVTLDPQRINFGSFGFENFLWIPLDEGAPPTDIQAVRFLKFVQDPDNKPVHLQSAGGSDRVATLRALVSYAIDGQTLEAALAEARLYNGGNELSPAQVEWLRRWAAAHDPGSHRRQ